MNMCISYKYEVNISDFIPVSIQCKTLNLENDITIETFHLIAITRNVRLYLYVLSSSYLIKPMHVLVRTYCVPSYAS